MSGRRAGLLFDSPLKARTLNDFWSHRWNLAFVEMNRRLVMGPLVRRFGIRKAMLGAFIVSGLLHELAISYPAGAGWGLPFLYFLIQGAGVFLERRLNLRSRGLAWAFILLPVPLLFPAPFRETFILPLFSVAHLTLTSRPLVWYLGLGLWITGVLQLVVLLASYQVPKLLRWREELPRLSPFNQKLMWTYGLFIVLCIIGFGTLTLALHHPLMLGGEIAVGLLLFMATFWLARIAVDVFYFKHEDWPKGPQFIAGHALLTSLFAFLVLNYAGLAAWHLLGK